jgi:hypothetical protein
MFHRKFNRSVFLGSILVLVLLALTACGGEQIVIPPSDNTPPTVEFHVSGAGENFVLGQDSIPISRVLTLRSRVTMIVVGRDRNGGVQNAIVRGMITVNCKTGGPIMENIRANNPQPGGVGSLGTTVLSAAYVFNVREWSARCPGGSATSILAVFNGRARNYHMGETTSSDFTMTYP